MEVAARIERLVRPDVVLTHLGARRYTVLPPDRRGAPYDRIAALYDRVVGGRLYNRVVWGIDRDRYGEVIADAVDAAGDGVLLDAGSGSALFSAPIYARQPLRAVLLDLSAGMLRRADDRVPGYVPVDLVQGDLYDLPFPDATFDAVLHFGVAHVLADVAPVFRELARVVRPGGTVHVGSLVRTDRWLGNTMLRLLHSAGEVAPSRTPTELAGLLAPHGEVALREAGSWAFAVLTRPA